MGDRISVSFVNGDTESVSIFSHWGGREFLNEALEYVEEYKTFLKTARKDEKKNAWLLCGPIGNMDPAVVMVDFIRWYCTKHYKGIIEDTIYLGKDHNDGDNSDQGSWRIDLQTGKFQ